MALTASASDTLRGTRFPLGSAVCAQPHWREISFHDVGPTEYFLCGEGAIWPNVGMPRPTAVDRRAASPVELQQLVLGASEVAVQAIDLAQPALPLGLGDPRDEVVPNLNEPCALLAAQKGGGSFEAVELELASLASVRALADQLVTQGHALDIVIANAGVGLPPLGQTEDGFETQFGVNHLGHFVLVNRLVPLMHAGTRVVMLSSVAHRFADADFSDPNFEHTDYDPMTAYARSKTANALFAVEFDRRHRGEEIRAVSVNPGSVESNLERHMPEDQRTPPPGQEPEGPAGLRKTAAQGAAPSVWAAVLAHAEEIGGRYCAVMPVDDDPQAFTAVTSAAQDPELARALWNQSETLVGERFPR